MRALSRTRLASYFKRWVGGAQRGSEFGRWLVGRELLFLTRDGRISFLAVDQARAVRARIWFLPGANGGARPLAGVERLPAGGE